MGRVLCINFSLQRSTEPPAISALWYSVMVLLIVTAIMMSLRYYQNEQFRKCFQYLQGFQLICLYLWYFAYHIPWSNSLPFYHCRLAMFAVLFFTRQMEKQTVLCLDGSEWSHLLLWAIQSLIPTFSLILRAFLSSSDITVS